MALAALLLVVLFDRLPIEGTSLAIDWKGLSAAIQGGIVRYSNGSVLLIAPWDAALMLPLGLVSMRASWGLIGFITLAVLVISIPRRVNRRLYWLAALLLALSFPSVRHLADGNFEALVIAGTLLILYGYRKEQPFALAMGLLLAVAKPQEVILLVLALGFYALLSIRRALWWKTGAILTLVMVPFLLWKGSEWLHAVFADQFQGSIMDTSLHAALSRASLPTPVLWVFWLALLAATIAAVWHSRPTLSREKAGMLIAASLLLSPYAAGNSILTVLAVGVVPLFLRKPWLGGLLMAMISLPYLFNRDLLFYWQAYYGTLTLLVAWAVFAWRVWHGADVRAGFAAPIRSAEIRASAESQT